MQYLVACRLAGRSMACEALELVACSAGGPGTLVGIVAGHAAKRAAAFGIAATAGPADPLRADPACVFRLVVAEPRLENVAIVALLGRHGLRGSARGVDDRQVRETRFKGKDMVASRAVAPLAADGAIGRLGADRFMPRSRVG